MSWKCLWMLCGLLVVGWALSGCATAQKKSPLVWSSTSGMAVYKDEFEFTPPPPEWKLVQVEAGGEFGFAFMKIDPGPFPSQSLFAYDEDPFGASRNLEERAREFFERYLWASAVNKYMHILDEKKVQVVGGEGLAALAEARDPVRKDKVKSEVVFGKRAGRVVAWYLTQWRPIDRAFDDSAFGVFDKFWESFKYLKKSIYEDLCSP
jgi:hypothetical protein